MQRRLKRKAKKAQNQLQRQIKASSEEENAQLIEFSSGESTFEFIEAADDKKQPSFKGMAYSGDPMVVGGWYEPVVVALDGIKNLSGRVPMLRDHDPNLLAGYATNIIAGASGLEVQGKFVTGEEGSKVVQAAKDGFTWGLSIGAVPVEMKYVKEGETVEANGRTHEGPVTLVSKSRLREISFVTIPADPATSASVAAKAPTGDFSMKFEQWLKANGFDKDKLDAGTITSLQTVFEAAAPASAPPVPAAGESAAPASVQAAADLNLEEHRKQLADETRRVNSINRICAGHNDLKIKLDNGSEVDLAAHAIENNWTSEKTELAVLRESRKAAPSGPGIHAKSSETKAEVLEASMLAATGWSGDKLLENGYKEETVEAASQPQWKGMGIHGLLDAQIRAAGMHYSGSRRSNEFIQTAFSASQKIQASTAGFSTISLPGILSNLANKTLVAMYNQQEVTWPSFCAIRSTGDFKPYYRMRLDADGNFTKVGNTGELKHISLQESQYVNQVETYGSMITLPRQTIINDDLDAFLSIPQVLGQLAATRQEEGVYKVLLAGETANFFTVGNGNLYSGADSALAIDSLGTARTMFRNQVDLNGKPILINPDRLLVPTTLEETAANLFSETRVEIGGDGTRRRFNNNPWTGLFSPIVSPYNNNTAITGDDGKALTGQSDTAWYLFANPSQRAALQIAFLNGQRAPVIENGALDFQSLGMAFRSYSDFGVAFEDPKAAIKATGVV